MNLFSQVITSEDDIYVYFEMIRQLHPASILDFGMLLKRIGAISRQAMHCAVPQDTRMDGVDFCSQPVFPIYEMVYDQIYEWNRLPDKEYDLAVMLGWTGFLEVHVLDHIAEHASAVLFDAGVQALTDYFVGRCQCQSLQTDRKTYGLAYCKGV